MSGRPFEQATDTLTFAPCSPLNWNRADTFRCRSTVVTDQSLAGTAEALSSLLPVQPAVTLPQKPLLLSVRVRGGEGFGDGRVLLGDGDRVRLGEVLAVELLVVGAVLMPSAPVETPVGWVLVVGAVDGVADSSTDAVGSGEGGSDSATPDGAIGSAVTDLPAESMANQASPATVQTAVSQSSRPTTTRFFIGTPSGPVPAALIAGPPATTGTPDRTPARSG